MHIRVTGREASGFQTNKYALNTTEDIRIAEVIKVALVDIAGAAKERFNRLHTVHTRWIQS